eukprot:gene9809-2002_t
MAGIQRTTIMALFCFVCAFLLHFPSAKAALEVKESIVEPAWHVKAATYPEWAHHHWVWLSHGGSGQDDCVQLARDYIAHNISVGAVDIDSTWEIGFNNFKFDTSRFPNASNMIDTFHDMGIRVILWITNMVDVDSPNYQEGYNNSYYIRNIFGEQGTVKWWHGKGSMIDYTNPAALQWWHKQMDNVLDLGIDGWKCDGTDPYILEFIEPLGYNGTITWQKLGDDRLIMSRPVDAFGPIYVRFSPKRVMVSGWVGDQDDTFDGLKGALKRYFQSAWDGYANFGSDIGGYRTPQKPRQAELFLRWAQVGAFSPLMENGGGGEHRPWMIDPARKEYITQVYRHFVDIHYSLVPYLLTTGSEALESGKSSISPLAQHETFIEKFIDLFDPDTYCYLLGDRILVCPVLNNGTEAEVTMPSYGTNWTYFFDSSKVFPGHGQRFKFKVPLSELPVFLEDGKIVPLNLSIEIAGFPRVVDALTAVVVRPKEFDTAQIRTTTYSEARGQGHSLSYVFTEKGLYIMASAHLTTEVAWLFVDVPAPRQVSHTYSNIDHHKTASLGEFAVNYDQHTRMLLVRSSAVLQGHHLLIEF